MVHSNPTSIDRFGIVLNPASGRGKGGRLEAELCARLDQVAPQSWSLVKTTAKGDAARCIQELTALGCTRIASAGGDGTLTECLEALMPTDIPLGVIPLGTGNDFGRQIGVRTLSEGLDALVSGQVILADVGEANGKPFLDTIACGFDSAVGQRVNEGFRHLKGTAAYIGAVVSTLRTYKCSDMEVEVDGEVRRGRAMLCAVCNCRSYGGGLNVAPNASIADGLLDVVIVQEMSKARFLMQFPKVFKGTHLGLPEVKSWKAREVSIQSDPPIRWMRDGEMEDFTPLKITVNQASRPILCLEITVEDGEGRREVGRGGRRSASRGSR